MQGYSALLAQSEQYLRLQPGGVLDAVALQQGGALGKQQLRLLGQDGGANSDAASSGGSLVAASAGGVSSRYDPDALSYAMPPGIGYKASSAPAITRAGLKGLGGLGLGLALDPSSGQMNLDAAGTANAAVPMPRGYDAPQASIVCANRFSCELLCVC
jgi:hypothetical protein